jgi:hypothetical protein
MNRKIGLLVVPAVVTTIISPLAVYADAISPGFKDTGKSYSKEAPKADIYGTGIGGRFMEASELRFEIDRLLQDGEYDRAIIKSKKACQLDPTDPTTHMLLARALTKKFEAKKGDIDEKLLAEAMGEWKMLWVHDADQLEQGEAKYNYLRMRRVSNALAKQKVIEEKERMRAKQALAQQRAEQAAQQNLAPLDEENHPNDGKSAGVDRPDSRSIAAKKKRFLLF